MAFKETVKRYGRLDTVFANAGINGTMAPIEDLQPEEGDETMTPNLKSTFLTCKYAIPHLKENGGSIIITSSINGPGAIKTHIGENTFPKKDKLEKIKIPVEYPEGSRPLEHHSGSAEQVTSLVSFLASDASSHIIGTELFIDGTESLLR